jgi:hypothetical protein
MAMSFTSMQPVMSEEGVMPLKYGWHHEIPSSQRTWGLLFSRSS